MTKGKAENEIMVEKKKNYDLKVKLTAIKHTDFHSLIYHEFYSRAASIPENMVCKT